MLSEVSHAQSFCNWLNMLRKAGAPIPNACVTDWSKALLNGITNSFTKFKTIEEYASSLYAGNYSTIYLRLDVAHTMHKYAVFLSRLRKPIKTFYMACIGQLVICTSKSDAELLITKILCVCLAETDGNLKNGKPTICEQAKNDLMDAVTTGKI